MAVFGHFLPAETGTDQRQGARRKLSLLAKGVQHDGTGIEVQIHNISGTGLLFESDIKLAACDRIEIELPHAGDITAVVIWASGRLFGCQFEGPVSPATLSAVELKSAVAPTPEPAPAIDPSPSVDDVHAATVIDEAFGDRLQRLRTSAGLSLAEVAQRMGVSAPSVSGWEKGRARPTRGRVVKLAAILGVPTSDLLDDAAPEEFQELVDRSREQIAHAAGVSPDRVRITIDY
ncbi:helix-turn-helix domain-containing protein [Sphingopyxis sp.]|uniref:helix-turn-helix domain-containing protein n=1 Tax=Sphingopyxis sp. TaxID=1908224 RepID=UPI001DB3DAA6|nr:helix-turn-helix domain-containing protein [Sphingopyxis sp.]MBW8295218.1 helix-turn-helix domain-containing protein [Sphingopyxis sp.]